jgi:hypothetical protein
VTDAGQSCFAARELEVFGRSAALFWQGAFHFASLFGNARTTSTSNDVGVTWPSFQAGNENVTFALPSPASLGARTGL